MSASASASLPERRSAFDALRLFAALSVAVGHATFALGQPFLWYSGSGNAWFRDGIVLFFVLSGYLVYQSAERVFAEGAGWDTYIRNRFLRVVPGLYAYTLMSCVLLVLIGAVNWQSLLDGSVAVWLAASALLMPFFSAGAFESFGTGKINPPLWSITAEVTFYLLLPMLFEAGRRFGFLRMIAMSAGVAAAGSIMAATTDSLIIYTVLHVTFLQYFSCFLLGMFWARYWESTPQHWPLPIVALALYVVVTAWVPIVGRSWTHPWLEAVPLSYVAIWLGHHLPDVVGRALNRLGDLSYGTYVWHWPVINYVLWSEIVTGAWAVPTVLVFSLLLAFMSWHLVEKRALKLKYKTRVRH